MLFQDAPAKRGVCVLLAGCLPMLLYLSHYVTNETLAALFATGAIVLCLRILLRPRPSLTGCAAMGICLGAAVLTKVTAVLIAPALFGALAIRLATQEQPVAVWLRALGMTATMAAAVCGWHYVRVWAHFGTPLVFSWDTAASLSWWQEDGYRTAAFFTRFSQGLTNPFFSGFNSFLDGIYSTLWGDGLWGGMGGVGRRPPWNYNLVAAGYLLALVPTVLVLLGAIVSCRRWLQRPTAEGFLLLGVAAAFSGALIFNCLEVPYAAAVKAFYALPALVPLCAFGAIGYDWLAGKSRGAGFLLGLLLTLWALNSLASLWIRTDTSQTQLCLAMHEVTVGRKAQARERLSRAARQLPVDGRLLRELSALLAEQQSYYEAGQWTAEGLRQHPDDATCRFQSAALLADQGDRKQAIAQLQPLIKDAPDNFQSYWLLASCLSQENRPAEALAMAQRGLGVTPANARLQELAGTLLLDQNRPAEAVSCLRLAACFSTNSPAVLLRLGQALAQQGQLAEAVDMFSRVLKMAPDNVALRLRLAMTLLKLGRAEESVDQFHKALKLAPDSPDALKNFAWLRATHPDPNLRNGPEAVAMAEHAWALTGNKVAVLAETLAAAYAEAGRFEEAADAARQAVSLARDAGDISLAAKNEALLKLYQNRQPYRESPVLTR
jgi:tetratricopeptide (TPR) repeat protein